MSATAHAGSVTPWVPALRASRYGRDDNGEWTRIQPINSQGH